MDFYSEENKRGGTNIDETLYNEITLFVPFSIFNINSAVSTMVHILDGNSEIVAHVKSNLCSLICLRHLIRSRAVTNRIFSPNVCVTCPELPC